MILYHVVTTYQLLRCIIYKELFHKEQACYILLSDFIKEKYPQYKQMEGHFFEKLFVFNSNEFFNDTENNMINNKHELVGKYLNENNIDLQAFSEIIVGSPNGYFGNYLLENEVYFTFLEETCELMSRSDSSFIDKILVFFGIDQKIQMDENSTILLTQHFSNLGIMSFEEHKKIYQLVVDYFVPETRLVIKPHPDDLMFYEGLFPQATVLKKNFPTELIPFVFTEKPQTVMTITSTSITNLMSYFENCIRFSTDFERYFNNTHQYYCAVKIISELIEDYQIYEMNSDKLLLENLLNISGNQFGRSIVSVNNLSQIPDKSIVIMDDFNHDPLPKTKEIGNFLKSVDRDSIIIFINSNKEFLFYDYPNKELLESIVPVEILHNSTVDETAQYSTTFFVYSKRKDIRNMINKQTFEKTLNSSQEIIKVEAMSEEQLRIKILEGILEATEKRLEHYIKLESELREKLNSSTNVLPK
ncbi:polysialyltransferase family glycosyltransferase [Neobacillus sp.]|uniref:polysialyltransferase family glycosyltransferase n=1 Tax=Neobacillus sp. TaxID=2675273 RepID=UPI00289A111C|nr:polysialyltransferase family glycosyltransferase [Neobacillus sp.]